MQYFIYISRESYIVYPKILRSNNTLRKKYDKLKINYESTSELVSPLILS